MRLREDEEEEARRPRGLRDPGAPTQAEIEEHNLTRLPYRSWCPACIAGKARDRAHRLTESHHDEGVPRIVVDYCFVQGEEDEETVAIQVAKDRSARVLGAHVVPRKGLASQRGAHELLKDIETLGYGELILRRGP